MNTVTRDVNVLVTDLHSPNPETRRAAAEALGELRYDTAIPDLVTLFSDSDPSVCEAAVQALVRIGGNEVVDALNALPRQGKVWERAARTLGKLATPITVEMLGEALFEGSSDAAMVACLALIDAGAIAGPVLARSLRHPSADVRARAAMALGRAQVRDALNPQFCHTARFFATLRMTSFSAENCHSERSEESCRELRVTEFIETYLTNGASSNGSKPRQNR
jgi:hypothetical protein